MKEADRIQDIEPFHVMALLARARELEAEGRNIIHMEIGEPDFPTPQPVIDAGMNAIKSGNVHYTPATGLPQLRNAISKFYLERYGTQVDANRVLITPGASGALMLALGVILDEGDSVLMADPGYPCNRNFVRFLSGEVSSVKVDSSSNYQLTLEHVKQYWQQNTKAVMIASPSNPTGTLMDKDTVQSMAEFIKKKNGFLIVDEIYHGLIYGAEYDTAVSLNDNIIVINSFSKYFNMTGWRVGWVVAPESMMSNMDKLAQNIFLATATPAQYAALAAFNPETIAILEERKNEFQKRRDYLLPELSKLGFTIKSQPQGAFYIYAGCEKFTSDSYQFAYDILERAGVAITPGKDFGEHDAGTHVRFAYTTSLENLREGIKRLGSCLA